MFRLSKLIDTHQAAGVLPVTVQCRIGLGTVIITTAKFSLFAYVYYNLILIRYHSGCPVRKNSRTLGIPAGLETVSHTDVGTALGHPKNIPSNPMKFTPQALVDVEMFNSGTTCEVNNIFFLKTWLLKRLG